MPAESVAAVDAMQPDSPEEAEAGGNNQMEKNAEVAEAPEVPEVKEVPAVIQEASSTVEDAATPRASRGRKVWLCMAQSVASATLSNTHGNVSGCRRDGARQHRSKRSIL